MKSMKMMLTRTKIALSDFSSSLKDGWNYFFEKKVEKYTLIILFIFLLSILDAVFTLLWIDAGLAIEANPLLESLVEKGVFSFLATKIFLTGIGCYILYKIKEKSLAAKRAIIAISVVYTIVIMYHLFGAMVSIDSNYFSRTVLDFLNWLS